MFLENAKFRACTIMMTINNLCLFSITDFFDDMMELKAKYGHHRPNLSLNMLRWPSFMSPLTLPDDIKAQVHAKLQKWYDKNKDSPLFVEGEMSQIKRFKNHHRTSPTFVCTAIKLIWLSCDDSILCEVFVH